MAFSRSTLINQESLAKKNFYKWHLGGRSLKLLENVIGLLNATVENIATLPVTSGDKLTLLVTPTNTMEATMTSTNTMEAPKTLPGPAR
jgi:hypothetical protein